MALGSAFLANIKAEHPCDPPNPNPNPPDPDPNPPDPDPNPPNPHPNPLDPDPNPPNPGPNPPDPDPNELFCSPDSFDPPNPDPNPPDPDPNPPNPGPNPPDPDPNPPNPHPNPPDPDPNPLDPDPNPPDPDPNPPNPGPNLPDPDPNPPNPDPNPPNPGPNPPDPDPNPPNPHPNPLDPDPNPPNPDPNPPDPEPNELFCSPDSFDPPNPDPNPLPSWIPLIPTTLIPTQSRLGSSNPDPDPDPNPDPSWDPPDPNPPPRPGQDHLDPNDPGPDLDPPPHPSRDPPDPNDPDPDDPDPDPIPTGIPQSRPRSRPDPCPGWDPDPISILILITIPDPPDPNDPDPDPIPIPAGIPQSRPRSRPDPGWDPPDPNNPNPDPILTRSRLGSLNPDPDPPHPGLDPPDPNDPDPDPDPIPPGIPPPPLTPPPAVTSSPPAVFPLGSCCGAATGPVTLACFVKGFFPPPVTVTWSGAAAAAAATSPPLHDVTSGLYHLSTRLHLPHGRQGRSYACSVAHPPSSTAVTKEVKACEGPVTPVPPEVKVLYTTSCSRKMGEESVELLCLISGFTPATVEVEWLVDGLPGLLTATQKPPSREEGATTYSSSSRTNVSRDDWLEGKTFTCQVKHPASHSVVQDHARHCSGMANPNLSNIVLYVLPPNVADLYITRKPKLRCLATNLPSDSGFQLSWVKEKPGVLNPDFLDLQEQFNGTYTATSALTISTQDWEAGERFTCTVKHSDLQLPLNKSISRRSGKVSQPSIFILPPHPEEMTQSKVTLTCLVYGFQPENLQVQWLKNHENVPEDHYVTTPPLKDGPKESTFFIYSKMVVLKSSWSNGDIYSCMVVHEGLPMKFTQRQAQKGPGK
ncbi:uncharacterized protein J5F26_017392 [Ciconia maguari]